MTSLTTIIASDNVLSVSTSGNTLLLEILLLVPNLSTFMTLDRRWAIMTSETDIQEKDKNKAEKDKTEHGNEKS
ncbi:hypothetical protein Tco_1050902, partial [Tanacetum coccineum]